MAGWLNNLGLAWTTTSEKRPRFVQNSPVSPIREPITFTHLTVMKDMRWIPGIAKTQLGPLPHD